MKIPFFYEEDKEMISWYLDIKEMIWRLKSSADPMRLINNVEKCKMFGTYLRGPAAVNWESMVYFGDNRNVWANIKKYYLTKYQG